MAVSPQGPGHHPATQNQRSMVRSHPCWDLRGAPRSSQEDTEALMLRERRSWDPVSLPWLHLRAWGGRTLSLPHLLEVDGSIIRDSFFWGFLPAGIAKPAL